jgi:hypothetical protein
VTGKVRGASQHLDLDRDFAHVDPELRAVLAMMPPLDFEAQFREGLYPVRRTIRAINSRQSITGERRLRFG